VHARALVATIALVASGSPPLLGMVMGLVGSTATTQPVCPDDALGLVRAYLSLDTLGVGLSTTSRDSSRLDTLGTEVFEETPDESLVVTAFKLTCLFASADSVILRLETRSAGTIKWDTAGRRQYKIFVPETRTSIGYPAVVMRGHRWKILGPVDATNVSPAAALRLFANLTDGSRRALQRLVGRPSPGP
jgi:hypothetical protein